MPVEILEMPTSEMIKIVQVNLKTFPFQVEIFQNILCFRGHGAALVYKIHVRRMW